jgi:hypothetical protein
MTAQTKIGGLDREALLRVWFLFYVWAGIESYDFMPSHPVPWLAWMAGAGLTCLLLYWHSGLAGIVGYVVSATAAAMMLPEAVSTLSAFFAGRIDDAHGYDVAGGTFMFVFRPVALAFVPTMILALHLASRHRLQRSFERSEAVRRHGRIIPPGAYYFVTFR